MIDLDFFAWRKPSGGRLLVPRTDPNLYEYPIDLMFADAEEAAATLVDFDLVDEAVEDGWVLVHYMGRIVATITSEETQP